MTDKTLNRYIIYWELDFTGRDFRFSVDAPTYNEAESKVREAIDDRFDPNDDWGGFGYDIGLDNDFYLESELVGSGKAKSKITMQWIWDGYADGDFEPLPERPLLDKLYILLDRIIYNIKRRLRNKG